MTEAPKSDGPESIPPPGDSEPGDISRTGQHMPEESNPEELDAEEVNADLGDLAPATGALSNPKRLTRGSAADDEDSPSDSDDPATTVDDDAGEGEVVSLDGKASAGAEGALSEDLADSAENELGAIEHLSAQGAKGSSADNSELAQSLLDDAAADTDPHSSTVGNDSPLPRPDSNAAQTAASEPPAREVASGDSPASDSSGVDDPRLESSPSDTSPTDTSLDDDARAVAADSKKPDQSSYFNDDTTGTPTSVGAPSKSEDPSPEDTSSSESSTPKEPSTPSDAAKSATESTTEDNEDQPDGKNQSGQSPSALNEPSVKAASSTPPKLRPGTPHVTTPANWPSNEPKTAHAVTKGEPRKPLGAQHKSRVAPPPKSSAATSRTSTGAQAGSPSAGKPSRTSRSQARQRILAGLTKRPTAMSCVAALLLMVIAWLATVQTQRNSPDQLENLSQTELIGVLSDLDLRSSQLAAEKARLQQARDQLLGSGDQQAVAREQARKRYEALAILAGTVPATGPGVVVTIQDPQGTVRASDLVNAIQELRDAGAEAMQINDHRITVSTAFVGPAGQIKVGSEKITHPMTIRAIGDAQTLKTALTFRGGMQSTIEKRPGAGVSIETQRDVKVSAVIADKPSRFASPVSTPPKRDS